MKMTMASDRIKLLIGPQIQQASWTSWSRVLPVVLRSSLPKWYKGRVYGPKA
jgi:hypothetical protein